MFGNVTALWAGTVLPRRTQVAVPVRPRHLACYCVQSFRVSYSGLYLQWAKTVRCQFDIFPSQRGKGRKEEIKYAKSECVRERARERERASE